MHALIDILNSERDGGGLSDRLITRQIASLYEKVLQVWARLHHYIFSVWREIFTMRYEKLHTEN